MKFLKFQRLYHLLYIFFFYISLFFSIQGGSFTGILRQAVICKSRVTIVDLMYFLEKPDS